MKTIDAATIIDLCSFALTNGEIAFVHLCNQALEVVLRGSTDPGHVWALEQVVIAHTDIVYLANAGQSDDTTKIGVMANSETVRPDGAQARSLKL